MRLSRNTEVEFELEHSRLNQPKQSRQGKGLLERPRRSSLKALKIFYRNSPSSPRPYCTRVRTL